MSIDNFDNIIKNKFDNFSETPPNYVFDNIKNDFTKIKYNNFNAKFVKLVSLLGATAIISTIILLNVFNDTNTNKKQKNLSTKDLSNNNVTKQNNNFYTNVDKKTTAKYQNNDTKNKSNKADAITINKTIKGKIFNIKINNIKIIYSSDDLIISKDKSYFYIKSNDYGIKKIIIKKDNKIINYIINFINTENNNINIADNDKEQSKQNIADNKNTKSANTDSDFDAKFIIKSPTCYNSNGKIYTVLNNGDYTFIWNDNSKEQNRRDIKSGNYTVTISNNNISKTYSLTVNDSGIVKTELTHEELTLQTNYPIYFINKTTIDNKKIKDLNNYSVYWSFGDGTYSTDLNPEHLYTSPGNYIVSLKVTGKEGCSDSVTYKDIIIPKTIINVPNAFTPNGDGINDIFKLSIKSVKNFECIILDKSGKQIYKWTDPDKGWDGKINGNNIADDGIYYYIAKGLNSNNKEFEKTGFFYLFKNKQ